MIDSYRGKGLHYAREVNRAHILSALDRVIPEAQIMAVLGVGRTAIWRTRSAYLEGGAECSLCDVAHPGKPRQYATDVETKITVLACSQSPAGAKRWTLKLLEQVAQGQVDIGPISRETIRQLLKKLPQATVQYDVVHWLFGRRISAANVWSARSLCPPVPGKETRRLSEREEKATAQGFAAPFANPARLAREAGLRIRARRTVVISDYCAKTDFVAFVEHFLKQVYTTAQRIHLAMDNLNTHFRKCFEEVLGARKKRHCCDVSPFTTRRNMPAGSTWLKSKSAFLTASVLISVSRTVPRSSPK